MAASKEIITVIIHDTIFIKPTLEERDRELEKILIPLEHLITQRKLQIAFAYSGLLKPTIPSTEANLFSNVLNKLHLIPFAATEEEILNAPELPDDVRTCQQVLLYTENTTNFSEKNKINVMYYNRYSARLPHENLLLWLRKHTASEFSPPHTFIFDQGLFIERDNLKKMRAALKVIKKPVLEGKILLLFANVVKLGSFKDIFSPEVAQKIKSAVPEKIRSSVIFVEVILRNNSVTWYINNKLTSKIPTKVQQQLLYDKTFNPFLFTDAFIQGKLFAPDRLPTYLTVMCVSMKLKLDELILQAVTTAKKALETNALVPSKQKKPRPQSMPIPLKSLDKPDTAPQGSQAAVLQILTGNPVNDRSISPGRPRSESRRKSEKPPRTGRPRIRLLTNPDTQLPQTAPDSPIATGERSNLSETCSTDSTNSPKSPTQKDTQEGPTSMKM